MVLGGIIGTVIAMGAISGVADRHNKNAYPGLNKAELDAECARYGIRGRTGNFTETHIRKIAARNNVPCNKHGVLPENGWKECVRYVQQYVNSDTDLRDFEQAWYGLVETQMKQRSARLKDPNSKIMQQYKKHDQFFSSTDTPDARWKSKTIVLEIKHWHGMPKEEHLKRMHELQDQTFWGRLCKEKPILRDNPRMPDSYTETWILYAGSKHEQGSKYTESVFKDWYKECCASLGYDAAL